MGREPDADAPTPTLVEPHKAPKHITGLHSIVPLPGIVITPVAPEVADLVRSIQTATTAYWNYLPLSAALESIDTTSPGLVLAAPADRSDICTIVRALRLFWQRQLVPLILVLPAPDDAIATEAYAGGADLVATPDMSPEMLRARARAMLRLRTLTALVVDSRDRAKVRFERSLESLLNSFAEPLATITAGRLDGQQSLSAVVTQELRRLWSIPADFLDLQRVQDGRFPLERTRFQASTLVRSVVERLAPVARARSLNLELSSWRRAITVQADRGLCERMLEGLIWHVLQNCQPPDCIDIGLSATDALWTVSVTSGMPSCSPEIQDQIFDVDAVISGEVVPGQMAAALAFSRAVAGAHGGDLQFSGSGDRHEIAVTLSL